MPHPSQWYWPFDNWNRAVCLSDWEACFFFKKKYSTTISIFKSGGTKNKKKSPYIIVKEFAYFTEVFPHAGTTVRTILLHLSIEMNIFYATITTKR